MSPYDQLTIDEMLGLVPEHKPRHVYRTTWPTAMKDMPIEIFQRICRHTVAAATCAQDMTVQALRLTWICRSWRAHALSETSLWNVVAVRDPYPWERSLEFVKRARHAPIDILVTDNHWNRNGRLTELTSENIHILLADLLPQWRQLRFIYFDLHDADAVYDVMHTFADPANPPLENLEGFCVRCSGASESSDEIPAWPFDIPWNVYLPPSLQLFGDLPPKLATLSLCYLEHDWSYLDCTNLVNLQLHHMPFEFATSTFSLQNMFTGASRLKRLSIAMPQFVGLPHGFDPQFLYNTPELADLRELTINECSTDYIYFFLHLFTAPHTLSLSLYNLNCSAKSTLPGLITTHLPSIRVVSLDNLNLCPTDASQPDMCLWMECMRDIRVLKLGRCSAQVLRWLGGYRSVIRSFRSRMPFAPEMTALVITRWEEEYRDLVPNLVRFRKRKGLPLRCVQGNVGASVVRGWADELQGLEVKVFSRGERNPEEDLILGSDWDFAINPNTGYLWHF